MEKTKPVPIRRLDIRGKYYQSTLPWMWGAKPSCDHEEDPNHINGIKCRKCGAWYCAG